MASPQVFTIEQASTFATVLALASNPKVKFGTQEQESTDEGWKFQVQLSAGFLQFGQTRFETIMVNVVADSDPLEGINPGTPVEVVGFQVGVMDKVIKDRDTGESKTVGAQVWYRADSIRSIAATGPARSSNGNGSKSAEKATAEAGV